MMKSSMRSAARLSNRTSSSSIGAGGVLSGDAVMDG